MAGLSGLEVSAVEVALPETVRQALPEMERILGLSEGGWPEEPALARILTDIAALVLTEEALACSPASSRTAEVQSAAYRLGAVPETVLRRIQRREAKLRERQPDDDKMSLMARPAGAMVGDEE